MVQFVPHGAAPPRNSTARAAERFLEGFMTERGRQNELQKIAEQAKAQRALKEYEASQAMQRLKVKGSQAKELEKYKLEEKINSKIKLAKELGLIDSDAAQQFSNKINQENIVQPEVNVADRQEPKEKPSKK